MRTSGRMQESVIPIEADRELHPSVGNKALGLQLLQRHGLMVPRSWVVLPDAGADELGELERHLRALEAGLLAVRSSGVDEDDALHSFAGVHESELGIPLHELADAVRRVSSSALTPRARAYRRTLSLPDPDGPCAVVVQRLVAAEAAGVAFGPWRGAGKVIIEAAAGLGESVVDGRSVPEVVELRLRGRRWAVHHRRRARQSTAVVVEEGMVRRRPWGPADRSASLVSAAMGARIADGVASLQRDLGRPLDLEWAICGEDLWWLQLRPQSRPLADPLPAGVRWSRTNLREVFPDIPSAFTRSCLPALAEGFDEALRRYGIAVDPHDPVLAFVFGRPVLHDRVNVVSDRLGVPRAAQRLSFGGGGSQPGELPSFRPGAALRHPVLLWRATRIAAGAEKEALAFLDRVGAFRQRAERVVHTEPGVDAVEELFAGAMAVGRELVVRQLAVLGALMSEILLALHTMRRHPQPTATLALLAAPGAKTVSTQLVEDLEAISAGVVGRVRVALFLRRFARGQETSYDTWRAELPGDTWEDIRSWLDQHGHRGPFESDMAWPRYADDARLVAELLAPMVERESLAPGAREELRRSAAEQTMRSVRAHCGWWAAAAVARRLDPIKRLSCLRERLRSEVVATYMCLRRLVLTEAGELVRSNRLDSEKQVWHLALPELTAALRDPSLDTAALVSRETRRLAAWRRVSVPNTFRTEDVEAMPLAVEEDRAPGSVLRGDGISPGFAEGPACVLQTPDEGARLVDGAILVAPATDPAWTPLFARAGGVVTELGGVLSHAGIVAREYGIPAVANVEDATRHLSDGETIWIDGSSGRVVRLRADGQRTRVPEPSGGVV